MRRLGAVVLACVVGVVWAQPEEGGPPPASVRVDAARMEVIEQWRPVTGELRASRRSMLAAETEGLVVNVCCREGDAVTLGQELVALDDTLALLAVERAEAEVASARATVAEREAQLERTQIELRRVRELAERNSASPSEVDDTRTAEASARARLEQARADLATRQSELSRAREELEDMRVRAPFDGRIVARMVEVGQWVDRGGMVLELVALDTVEAWLDVPQAIADRLRGQDVRVRVRVDATGQEIEAALTSLVPSADPLSRLFPARVVLDNADGRLKPGMSVVGLVPSGRSEPTLTVSKDAIRSNDAGEFVFWNAGGRAVVAPVERLFASGMRVAVRAPGLPPDAAVIVEGNERLFPGQPVMVLEGPAGTGAGEAGADAARAGG